MKAKLEFNLPHDLDSLNLAVQSEKMYKLICSLQKEISSLRAKAAKRDDNSDKYTAYYELESFIYEKKKQLQLNITVDYGK